jgi:hypothetical protein
MRPVQDSCVGWLVLVDVNGLLGSGLMRHRERLSVWISYANTSLHLVCWSMSSPHCIYADNPLADFG